MTKTIETEVIVVGAGPTGLASALACVRNGFDTRLVDTSRQASAEASRGRSAALFSQTVSFLRRLGVWDACSRSAEPLKALQFIDDTERIFRAPDSRFDAREIGQDCFGYNIANADLIMALQAESERQGVPIVSAGPITRFEEAGQHARMGFENGTTVAGKLVIAADGRSSAVRRAVRIRSLSWTYDQIAIATSFSHERPHEGVCIELHRKAGPFTIIPLPGFRSSLVWVERKSKAESLLALDEASFAKQVEAISRLALGRVSDVAKPAGFPLSSLVAREYGRARVALCGEAAHAVPPIGAQGLNLGFRDVEVLTQRMTLAKERGEDIGGDRLLRDYSASRRGDIVTRTIGADILNRSLLSGFLPLTAARGLGLYALASIGPLRRSFMKRGIAPANFI